jgi:hypothetical protein
LRSEAIIHKAQNKPSSQLTEATSCPQRLDIKNKAKELGNILAIKR